MTGTGRSFSFLVNPMSGGGSGPAAVVPVARPVVRTHARRHVVRAKPKATAAKSTAPFTTISRAADRVIEVIPGAVILDETTAHLPVVG